MSSLSSDDYASDLIAIAEIIQSIKSENDKEARPAIRNLVINYRETAIPAILEEIDKDQVLEEGEARRLKYSKRWNELGLALLSRNPVGSLEIFLHVSRREQKSAATFNNLGCVLATIGLHDKANWWFAIAHANDVGAVGLEKAKQLPAFRNLQLLQKTASVAAFESDKVGAPEAIPQQLLSKVEAKRAIITDFFLGGILAGFVFLIISGVAGYVQSLTNLPAWEFMLAIGSIGGIACSCVFYFYVYRKARG